MVRNSVFDVINKERGRARGKRNGRILYYE